MVVPDAVVVDVVVELELVVVEVDVVEEGSVVVVEVVEVVAVAALGVTVQQALNVCGTPGADALTPALSATVEYSQSA